MTVIGFPSSRGQMPVVSMTGFCVGTNAENKEEALDMLKVMLSEEALQEYAKINRVISPSKNI